VNIEELKKKAKKHGEKIAIVFANVITTLSVPSIVLGWMVSLATVVYQWAGADLTLQAALLDGFWVWVWMVPGGLVVGLIGIITSWLLDFDIWFLKD